MRVRILRDSYKGCPKELLDSNDPDNTKRHYVIGTEVDVHAIVRYNNQEYYCIFDKFGDFTWEFKWMFEVIDYSVSKDWIIKFFDGQISMIIGPEIIANSAKEYEKFVECDPDIVKYMNERYKIICENEFGK